MSITIISSKQLHTKPSIGKFLLSLLLVMPMGISFADTPNVDNSSSPSIDKVLIEGKRVSSDDKPWKFNQKTRYSHSLPEVDGPRITVTRRTSVEDITQNPAVADNSWRELVDQLPSLIMAEQQNPSALNFSYRGIGNPQESEYVLMLEDNIPMEMDFIGFPTIYYQPFSQSLARIEMIRGGSGLLYGPEAAPVLNLVDRVPSAQPALNTELIVGDNSLVSGFADAETPLSTGNLSANIGHRQSQGFRSNGDYQVDTFNLRYSMPLSNDTQLTLKTHVYQDDSALAGLMSHAQYLSNPNQATTPNDHLWMQREQWIAELTSNISDSLSFNQKVYQQYSSLTTRNETYSQGMAIPNSATLNIQQFSSIGADGRWLWRWSRGNALTAGYSFFSSQSPYNIYAMAQDDVSYNLRNGTASFVDHRSTDYGALFAENVFRFNHFHALLSGRLDHELVKADQLIASHPLIGPVSSSHTVPLFGLGLGNDFGRGNETYFNMSQGFRPVRYLDISSPNSYLTSENQPKPTHYVNTELGIHGWPLKDFYYDVGLFDVKARDRIESEHLTQTQVIDVNTGNTDSRGLEMESSVNLAQFIFNTDTSHHLQWSQALTLLHAEFTSSINASQIGNTPAYSPSVIAKSSLLYTNASQQSVKLIVTHVASQFFQDANVMVGTTPAQIPAYTVWDIHANGQISSNWRWEFGVNNLFDRNYYSRVFLSGGTIEPAARREIYLGVRASLPSKTL